MLDPDLPINDGALKCITVKQREGAIAGIPRWPVVFYMLSAAFAGALVVFTDPTFFTAHTLTPFIILSLMATTFTFVMMPRALIRKRDGAWLFSVGVLALFVAFINNIV